MPHVIIECSDSATVQDGVCDALIDTLMASNQFAPQDIKVRVYSATLAKSGIGASHIALTLKLLAGRSLEVRHALAQSLVDALKDHSQAVQYSVEVVEISPVYLKC